MAKTNAVRKQAATPTSAPLAAVSTPTTTTAPFGALQPVVPVVPAAAAQGQPIPCPIQCGIAQAAYVASVTTGTHAAVGAPSCQVPRAGTARHVAYTVLQQLAGSPLPVVLAALKVAEIQWHLNATRSVKGVAPAGWLRTLMCTVK